LGSYPHGFQHPGGQTTVETISSRGVANLLAVKRAGVELDRGPRIEVLSRFIEEELDRWDNNSTIHQKRSVNSDKLDKLFRVTLAKAWGYSEA
jgi:hypothetical protein